MEAQSVSFGPDESAAGIVAAKRRGHATRLLVVIAVHVAVVVLWQLSVDFFRVPAFILPSPIAALKTLGSPNYAWPANTLVSATEIAGGYLLGVFIGVTLALLFYWSR